MINIGTNQLEVSQSSNAILIEINLLKIIDSTVIDRLLYIVWSKYYRIYMDVR